MGDFLVEVGQNPQARKLIKSLGLPIPMPEKLRRARGPWEERPLADMNVVFGAAPEAALTSVIAETLAAAGANPHVVGDATAAAPFQGPGESYGRPAKVHAKDASPELRAGALVFDATGIEDPAGLRALYEFFHPWAPKLGRCGRVVVLGRPPQAEGGASPAKAATRAALEGFIRSMAKEAGRSGSTAQMVYVEEGAESRLPAVLRFLLSSRSAFVTGQPLTVTSKAANAAASAPFVRPLDGKIALVTGAARGIGAATARLLAAEGARVVCLDRPADDGPTSQLAREIGGATLLADVSDPEAPKAIASDLLARFGGVDIVVHNAGVTRDKTIARMSEAHWDQVMDINLTAVVRITEALRAKALRDGGRVICLSSIAGIAGNMGQTNYAASKAGVIGFVRSLADAVADRGITVNAIAPGFIETRLTAAIPIAIREAARRMSSLGQGGLPDDVGQAITFLATPGAVGVTGTILRVCGGSLVGA